MNSLKSLVRRGIALLVMVALVGLALFGSGEAAWARRASGRVGGSTFRAPARRAPQPINRGGNYYGTPSSGLGNSLFYLPFLFGGGGNLLSLFVLITIGGVLVQAFRNSGIANLQSKVTIAKVQVGLLANARGLQSDLNRLAMESDTRSGEGLAQILQETTLSLLRHPEYWAYGKSNHELVSLDRAEQSFNTMAMAVRSKQEIEAISNVNNRLQEQKGALVPKDQEDPSEYIVVTVLVAAGDLPKLNDIRSAEQLQKALSTLGAIPGSKLLALEVIWEPQSVNYTLTADQMVTVYPDLVRL